MYLITGSTNWWNFGTHPHPSQEFFEEFFVRYGIFAQFGNYLHENFIIKDESLYKELPINLCKLSVFALSQVCTVLVLLSAERLL